MNRHLFAGLLSLACIAEAGAAPAAHHIPYGTPISLADAKTCAAAAIAEAEKNEWLMVVTIVDGGGHVVLTERMDGAQYGSLLPAVQKAEGAAAFRRPTKVFEDMIAKGGAAMRIVTLPGVLPIDGGLPIVRDGKLIGAVGTSGGTSAEDGVAAAACVAALEGAR